MSFPTHAVSHSLVGLLGDIPQTMAPYCSMQVASFKEVTLGGDKEHYVHISPASSWILAGASGLRLREARYFEILAPAPS